MRTLAVFIVFYFTLSTLCLRLVGLLLPYLKLYNVGHLCSLYFQNDWFLCKMLLVFYLLSFVVVWFLL